MFAYPRKNCIHPSILCYAVPEFQLSNERQKREALWFAKQLRERGRGQFPDLDPVKQDTSTRRNPRPTYKGTVSDIGGRILGQEVSVGIPTFQRERMQQRDDQVDELDSDRRHEREGWLENESGKLDARAKMLVKKRE